SILFGDYEFFNHYDFEEYFIKRFRIRKEQIFWTLTALLILSSISIGFQLIFQKSISIGVIIIEFLLVIGFLRLVHYLILLQFKQYNTTVETIGYFVVNELLVILDTSHSLKEATKFIILSDYPVFSKLFKEALVLTHFGFSLEYCLKKKLKTGISGDIQSTFLHILEIWEISKNLAVLSKNRILNRISEQIMEETEKIDLWASLSSGLVYLSPPVILCFLLISGNMNFVFGLVITLGMMIGSFIFHPDEHLTSFSGRNQLILSYDKKSLDFLVILSENLLRGKKFEKSLNDSLYIIGDNLNKIGYLSNSRNLAQFKLGITQNTGSEILFLEEIFSKRILHLIYLAKRFEMVDTQIAGKNLLAITNELRKTNELMNKGISRRKAADFQSNIIQFLALISLAIIAGASSYFLYVVAMLDHTFTEPYVIQKRPNFDLIYLLIALVMSFLPIRRISIQRFRNLSEMPWREILGISRFLLFLILYVAVKSFLGNIY
ncbi:MAG: hypothetical protein ACFE8U_18500, partial [Candidatus Hermodarchaeota archaeon]